jgi:hypothetical protein
LRTWRHLGAYLEDHQTQNEEERRQTHLTRDPKSFMRDYGAEELIRNNVRESYRAGRDRQGDGRTVLLAR